MDDTADTAQVIIRPPIAWAVAVLVGVALNWLMPLPFISAAVPAGGLGAMVFALALALFAWAIVTMTRAGSNVPTSLPTTTIVDTGPLPVHAQSYLPRQGAGAHRLGHCPQQPLAVADACALRPFIRYGVVAREEADLERKFGDVYRRYRGRVRRWL